MPADTVIFFFLTLNIRAAVKTLVLISITAF